ncbi:serine/threonine-protein phosphatase 7 long form homolog [Apium graveolens]|uniref:serine/threonine-protein phosphatase 7 long form homolog n=1 Tax=Apium graveolens TaxID=4045 RepID=UPI003D7ADF05
MVIMLTLFLKFCLQSINPGLIDGTLLHLQPKHRSAEIWRVGGGDAMRFRHLNPNKETINLDCRMIPFLQSSGFYGVARLSTLQLDWSLLSTLVERWRPETHTFHLPMGEVTITLQDVGVLLGLPIDGRALIANDIPGPGDVLLELVASIFGCAPESSRLNGARIPLSFFTSLTPHYLSEDASLDEYVWGAAILAFLYRELCKGCKKGKEEVTGCLLLLQLWA